MKVKHNIWLMIICICLIGVAFVSIVNLQLEINDLKEKKSELQARKEALTAQIEEKQYRMALPVDDEYVIRIARERLNYHLPGEKIYTFGDDD